MDTDNDFVSVNGVHLAWHEWGSDGATAGRPTFILCHGFTGSSLDFSHHTEALAAGGGTGPRRVVTLDQRGHGHSTKTHDTASYTIDQFVDDLIGFIGKVGGGPVDLLGHSMGGRVALGVVLARPDLIGSLILMDTSAWSFLPADVGIQTLLSEYMAKFDPSRGVPQGFGIPGPEDDLIAAATTPEWQAQKDEMLYGTDAYMIKAMGTALLAETDGRNSVRSQLAAITCPTTVLAGAKDHPLVDQAPDLAKEVGDGRLTVIDGAYHSPQLTHQPQWRAAVEAHLAWVAS